jgi:hypothetical protein
MDFDGRVDILADIVKPLTVQTRLHCRRDVYYLKFDLKNAEVLRPAWDNLISLLTPLMKLHFPNATVISATPNRVNYRLGSLFDFLQNIQENQ